MDRGEPRGPRLAALAVLATLTCALAWSLALPEQNPAARTAMETASRIRCVANISARLNDARSDGDAELVAALEQALEGVSAGGDTAGAMRRPAAR